MVLIMSYIVGWRVNLDSSYILEGQAYGNSVYIVAYKDGLSHLMRFDKYRFLYTDTISILDPLAFTVLKGKVRKMYEENGKLYLLVGKDSSLYFVRVDTSTLSVGFAVKYDFPDNEDYKYDAYSIWKSGFVVANNNIVFATDTFGNVLWAKVFNDTVYLADWRGDSLFVIDYFPWDYDDPDTLVDTITTGAGYIIWTVLKDSGMFSSKVLRDTLIGRYDYMGNYCFYHIVPHDIGTLGNKRMVILGDWYGDGAYLCSNICYWYGRCEGVYIWVPPDSFYRGNSIDCYHTESIRYGWADFYHGSFPSYCDVIFPERKFSNGNTTLKPMVTDVFLLQVDTVELRWFVGDLDPSKSEYIYTGTYTGDTFYISGGCNRISPYYFMDGLIPRSSYYFADTILTPRDTVITLTITSIDTTVSYVPYLINYCPSIIDISESACSDRFYYTLSGRVLEFGKEEEFKVYDVLGRLVYKGKGKVYTFKRNGVFIVEVKGKRFKVVIR